MTYEGILKLIDKNILSPLYLFYGEEDLLIEELTRKIQNQLIEPSAKDFNIDTLWGNETTPETIIEKAETLPFLLGKRLIIVKGIDSLIGGEEKKLIPYISSPSPSTCIIFTAIKIDSRKNFYSILTKKWTSVHLKPLNKRQTAVWISNRAKIKNLSITPKAIEALIELTGTNLRIIDSELEKLSLYVLKDTAGPTEVNKIVKGTWHDSIFSLTDAVGKKDVSRALHLLRGILNSGESPHSVFGMILRQIRLIWLVKFMKQNREASSEIPKRAGFAPFLLRSYMDQADCFEFQDLKKNFYRMQKADLDLKSDLPPIIVLEKLLLDLGSNRVDKTIKACNFSASGFSM